MCCGIGGDEDFYLLVVGKSFLCLFPIFAADAAMDRYNGFRLAEESPDSFCQVIQRIAVFGEDDQFPAVAFGVKHRGIVL